MSTGLPLRRQPRRGYWGLLLLLLGTGVALLGCWRAEPDRNPLTRPAARSTQAAPSVTYRNLVLVVADTLSSRHLASYGYPRSSTPFLTRFAGEGVQFQGYAASSWTRSSMATLFTGLYPQRHRTLDRNDELPADVPFLSELLEKQGFQTVAYITNPNVGKPFGFDRGYAEFKGNGGGIPPASVVRREVAKLLPQLQSRFYLYIHLIDPHDPYTPQRAWDNDPPSREEYVQPQEIRKSGKPPSARLLTQMRNQYDGEIHEMDRAIEGMFDDLESLGLLNDTLVVFTSDHGEEFYEHQDLTHGSTLYDEVLLVPFVLGNLRPPMQSRSSTEIFHQVDFLPTVLEALGLSVPAKVDGISQWLPISNGEPLAVWDLLSHLDLDKKQFFAIQAGRHKLILSEARSGAQFFDLGLDPQERTPLSPTSPEAASLVRRLRSVDRSLAATSFRPGKAKTDADTLATLKALGYIQ